MSHYRATCARYAQWHARQSFGRSEEFISLDLASDSLSLSLSLLFMIKIEIRKNRARFRTNSTAAADDFKAHRTSGVREWHVIFQINEHCLTKPPRGLCKRNLRLVSPETPAGTWIANSSLLRCITKLQAHTYVMYPGAYIHTYIRYIHIYRLQRNRLWGYLFIACVVVPLYHSRNWKFTFENASWKF